MAQSEATRVREWLKTKGVLVPNDWAEQCIQFVKEDLADTGDPCTFENVVEKAYEQWTLADLREIQEPVFPKHLAAAHRIVLNNVYCVQVNSVIDISVSAYSQYQKCAASEGNNTDIDTEAEEQAKPWEPKPTRMLSLELTDGLITVKGIEDRPIPTLRPDLPPGFKVRLHGRMECRKGVLFLGSDNVDVLGGNVESLIEDNALGKVLKRKLTAESNGDGGNSTQWQFSGDGGNSSEQQLKRDGVESALQQLKRDGVNSAGRQLSSDGGNWSGQKIDRDGSNSTARKTGGDGDGGNWSERKIDGDGNNSIAWQLSGDGGKSLGRQLDEDDSNWLGWQLDGDDNRSLGRHLSGYDDNSQSVEWQLNGDGGNSVGGARGGLASVPLHGVSTLQVDYDEDRGIKMKVVEGRLPFWAQSASASVSYPHPPAFASLKDKMNNMRFASGPTVCTVRVLILEIGQKLSVNHGSKWTVSVVVHDGTMQVECDIENDLVTRLLRGFTAQQAWNAKKKVPPDANELVAIESAMERMYQFLSMFGGLIQLEFYPTPVGTPRPVRRPMIKNFRRFNETDLTRLRSQVSKMTTTKNSF